MCYLKQFTAVTRILWPKKEKEKKTILKRIGVNGEKQQSLIHQSIRNLVW